MEAVDFVCGARAAGQHQNRLAPSQRPQGAAAGKAVHSRQRYVQQNQVVGGILAQVRDSILAGQDSVEVVAVTGQQAQQRLNDSPVIFNN